MNDVATPRISSAIDATPATAKGLRLSPVPVERFDEYAVVARLGHGGMAEVILGLAQGLPGFRKLVAIKRLHAHCEEDPELVKMFVHEASLAALLSHPNVVQTHKVGCADGRHFIAMEYLEGQPLSRALPRLCSGRAGLDPVLAARLVSDVLAGLAHAHDARDYAGNPLGLVHRDVSPQNLFVTYEGQLKLLDFGIAKASSAALSSQTRPGLIKGKLSYIAPEQARGAVDRRADLWSAGVVLWEALSGRRLFRGDDEVAVLRAVLSAEVPPLRVFCPDVPEALAQVVSRALRRDREQRYPSALEMKHEIDNWLGTQDSRQGRIALAQVMQARFSEAIVERRAAVLECFAAVEHEEQWQALAHTDAELLRASVPPPQARSKGLRRGALAGLLVLGSAVAVGFAAGPKRGGVDARSAQQAQLAAWGFDSALADRASGVASVGADDVAERPAAPSPHRVEAPAILAAPVRQPAPAVRAAPISARAPEGALRPMLPSAASAALPVASAAHAIKRRVRPLAAEAVVAAAPNGLPSASGGLPEPTLRDAVTGSGRLRLEATPYAVVSLDGRRLGITPIDVELPATAHTLTLRNPERGIETTYRVQIVPGESLLRRVELE